MTAAWIIEEIKHLPEAEQAQVIEFVRQIDQGSRLTGTQLKELARKLQECTDESEASA